MNLAEAKDRIRIPDVWRHFNFPGEPKASCKSPFRDERKPSFSVYADGTLWNDFATGEAGDAVDFFQRASGLSQTEACRKFIELAGGIIVPTAKLIIPCTPKPTKPKPVFPDFRTGTDAELRQLARLRNIGLEGIQFAHERGLLWFASLKGFPAWIITDAERLNAQARRMDGKLWPHLEGNPKAWTAKGSWASWPIGIKEAQGFPCIALVEGGPDFLAAHYIALWEQAGHYTKRDVRCVPVAMLGASQRIHEDALPMFAGKRVRIFGHADEAGREAVERWARQLEGAGADVDAFDFGGLRMVDERPVKDFNDSLCIHADDYEQDRSLWKMLP